MCIFLNVILLFCFNHHHHHIVLVARISLTLSRHSSLSFIALGRSSRQHPVSSHSCWMYVRAGRPAFCFNNDWKFIYFISYFTIIEGFSRVGIPYKIYMKITWYRKIIESIVHFIIYIFRLMSKKNLRQKLWNPYLGALQLFKKILLHWK